MNFIIELLISMIILLAGLIGLFALVIAIIWVHTMWSDGLSIIQRIGMGLYVLFIFGIPLTVIRKDIM